MPRTQSTTSPPQSLAQRPPAAIPAVELRHLPADSPSRPPLAKLSLPLGSPAPARAKPPPRGPRTGPPATNRRRAHWRPGSLPADDRFTRAVRPWRCPPPSALANVWARSDAVAPAHPRRLPAHGPQLGRKRSRARARDRVGRTPPPLRPS
jgi:hypothetical protein